MKKKFHFSYFLAGLVSGFCQLTNITAKIIAQKAKQLITSVIEEDFCNLNNATYTGEEVSIHLVVTKNVPIKISRIGCKYAVVKKLESLPLSASELGAMLILPDAYVVNSISAENKLMLKKWCDKVPCIR